MLCKHLVWDWVPLVAETYPGVFSNRKFHCHIMHFLFLSLCRGIESAVKYMIEAEVPNFCGLGQAKHRLTTSSAI